MKKTKQKRKRIPAKKAGSSSDATQPQIDADKSGTDDNADQTIEPAEIQKFNKASRERNPDMTLPEHRPEIKL